MSTPSATARYVIAADDKSGSALKSVIRGFKDMDRDVRNTVKTLNSVLGIFVGVQLTQAFRKVVDATASASGGASGFATALKEVKDAAGDLLAAKSGLPEATKNLNELRDILKDPSVKSAADAITSSLITGFTKAAKVVAETVAGIRELSKTGQTGDEARKGAKTRQEVIDAIGKQIEEVDAQIDRVRSRPGGGSVYSDDLRTAPGTYDSFGNEADLQKRRAALIDQQLRAATSSNASPGHGSIPVTSYDAMMSAAADRQQRAEDDRHEAYMRNLSQEIAAYKVSIVGHEQNTKAILTETERYLDQQVAVQDLEEIDLNAIEAKKTFIKSVDTDLKAMEEIWKEAARGMYNAWEQFFFDPFRGGLKGLALGILDVIRHAIAAQSALAIMKSLSDYGSKNSGIIGTIASVLGGSFGGSKASGGPLQQGKWYIAGENGPERIWGGGAGAFAGGYGGGGSSVVINNYMDNRGATQEFISQLPAVLKANNDAVRSQIRDEFSRRPPPGLRR